MTKKLIRLTEEDLHNIIRKSVNNILKEDYCWWGDTRPLESIMKAAYEITTEFEKQYGTDLNSVDFDPEDRAKVELYGWAKKVQDEAEHFLQCNQANVPVGE